MNVWLFSCCPLSDIWHTVCQVHSLPPWMQGVLAPQDAWDCNTIGCNYWSSNGGVSLFLCLMENPIVYELVQL